MSEPLDLEAIEARLAARKSPEPIACDCEDCRTLWDLAALIAEVKAWRQVARNAIAEHRAEHPRASMTLDEDVAQAYADRDDPLAPFGREP